MFESDNAETETADVNEVSAEETIPAEASEAPELSATADEGEQGVLIPDELADAEIPKEFVDSFQLLSVLESVFFASDKPVSLATLKQVFEGTTVDTKTLKKALEEMQMIYAEPTRGVTLEEVTGGWQLRTKLDNMDFLKRISKARPFKLSGPALEVLSIIAYKQPIIKNEVDQIRGVESGHLVRALMEKGLVSFEGKTDLPGKPMAYSTTRKFLEIFGLRNIQELPTLSEIDQLLPEGIGEEEEKETLSSVTDMMSQALTSSYSEGEEELSHITEKINAIDTSSEFFEEEKRRQKEKRDREKAEDIREALALGELVENRDKKWLERYEAQLALANAAPSEEALQQAIAAASGEEQSESTELKLDSESSDDSVMSATEESVATNEDGADLDRALNESSEDSDSEPVG